MSGEDELRQLDEAYAAGQLSTEDYRQRRDELLRQSGGQQGQRHDPFPPAFRWETAEPNETTQYITPVSHAAPGGPSSPDNRSDQTQVIRTGGPEPTGDSDTTQVVAAQPPRSGPADLAAAPPNQGPPNQGWNIYQPFPPADREDQELRAPAPNDGSAPPWAALDVADPGPMGWDAGSHPEPDAFEADPAPGRGRIFAIIGAVMLIAVLVTGTVLFLTLGSDSTDDPTVAGPPAAPTTPAPPEPFGPVVVPTGTPTGETPRTYSPTELDDLDPLPPAELMVIKRSGIAGARSVIVDYQGTTTSLWAFTSSRNPEDLREELDTDQEERFGWVRSPDAGPAGLRVYTSEQLNAERQIVVFRTHYVSGRDLVRVEVFAGIDDPGAARDRFDAVLADQLDHNPPT